MFTLMAGLGAALDAQSGPSGPNPALFAGLKYRMIGPARGGRVTTVTGVAEQPNVFYMGGVGGGVWKTTDYGQSWWNISDGYLATGSIGAINVADSDANVIYVGTGSDGIRSNVITGKGVYKSTDAGKTWTLVGLEDVGQIGAVEIHPSNPNVVFVAALGNAFAPSSERGVYRSTDGGANWEKVLFVSDSTGAIDLEFAPDNPQVIYASMWRGERKPWTIISGAYEGGVYKSSDGGDNWTHMTNGLPQGLRGKSDLAVSPVDPNRVYVLMEAPEPDDGLYRSDDRGQTWYQVTSYNPILNRPFYYTNLDADPTNADIVYVNNEDFYKSVDGGKNFGRISTPHGDNHDMWINPKTAVPTSHWTVARAGLRNTTNRPPRSIRSMWTTGSRTGCTRDSRTIPRSGCQAGRRIHIREARPAIGWRSAVARPGPPSPNPATPTSCTPTARAVSGGTIRRPDRSSSTTWAWPTFTATTRVIWSTGSNVFRRSTSRLTTRTWCTTDRSSCTARRTTERRGSRFLRI
jgi:photosystem II stability/assembly factor-like uncharacterized protein